jgi:trk system potassium uptake protein TrkA
MFVIIAGGGRTGTQLATTLLEQNHLVRVIEHRRGVLTRIHRELPTEVIYEGNPTEVETLEQAGARSANVLAACLPEDENNLVICFLARMQFNVPRTIARINNPRNAWLFDDKFHVDVALNNAAVMAGLIQEEMSLGDMMILLKLRRGDYSLVEEKVAEGASIIGRALKDLGLGENCVISAIIRDGKVVLPRGQSLFQVGDEILAISNRDGTEELIALLTPVVTEDHTTM